MTYGAVKPVEKKLEPVPQLEDGPNPVPDGALDGAREPDREFKELVKGTPLEGELVGTSPDAGGNVPDVELLEFVNDALLGYEEGPVLNGMLPVGGTPDDGGIVPLLELIELVKGALLGYEVGPVPSATLPGDGSPDDGGRLPDRESIELVNGEPDDGDAPEASVELAPLVPEDVTAEEIGDGPVPDGSDPVLPIVPKDGTTPEASVELAPLVPVENMLDE